MFIGYFLIIILVSEIGINFGNCIQNMETLLKTVLSFLLANQDKYTLKLIRPNYVFSKQKFKDNNSVS